MGSHEPSCGIIPKLRILYFDGNYQFFQKSPGIKFLYDRGRELFHLLTGETHSTKSLTREDTGTCLTGALGQGICDFMFNIFAEKTKIIIPVS